LRKTLVGLHKDKKSKANKKDWCQKIHVYQIQKITLVM